MPPPAAAAAPARPDVVATPAGRPAPRLLKRPADDRLYRIDCGPLLRPGELLSAVQACEAPGLGVSSPRTREGRHLEVRISASELAPGESHRVHILQATIRTTHGAIGVAVEVRVLR